MFSEFCQDFVLVHSSGEGQSSKQRIKVLPFTGEFGTSAFYHNFLTGHKRDHHTVAGPVAHSTLNECKREEFGGSFAAIAPRAGFTVLFYAVVHKTTSCTVVGRLGRLWGEQ